MKKKIGWGIQGFIVFLLLCGLSIPLGIVGEWWYSVAFVGGVVFVGGFIGLAVRLTD